MSDLSILIFLYLLGMRLGSITSWIKFPFGPLLLVATKGTCLFSYVFFEGKDNSKQLSKLTPAILAVIL